MHIFWIILAQYVFIIVFVIYLFFFGSNSSLWPIQTLHRALYVTCPSLCKSFVPKSVWSCGERSCAYLFQQRNRFYTSLYLCLHLVALAQFLVDVVPLSGKVHSDPANLRVAILCWVINIIIWLTCVFSDPGVITDENVRGLSKIYSKFRQPSKSPSSKLAKSYKQCYSCKRDKIARSKHCSFCDKCMWRADHHCVWINNCVAGNNTFAFHCFLASLIIELAFGAFTIFNVISDVVRFTRLWELRYQDMKTMKTYPMDHYAISQHMVKEFPRITIFGAFYALLSVGIFVFFIFHQFLVLSNYTTREMFRKSPEATKPTPVNNKDTKCTKKSDAVVKCGKNIADLLAEEDKQKRKTSNQNDIITKLTFSSSPYNYGFLLNIFDAFLPKLCYKIRLRLKIA